MEACFPIIEIETCNPNARISLTMIHRSFFLQRKMIIPEFRPILGIRYWIHFPLMNVLSLNVQNKFYAKKARTKTGQQES